MATGFAGAQFHGTSGTCNSLSLENLTSNEISREPWERVRSGKKTFPIPTGICFEHPSLHSQNFLDSAHCRALMRCGRRNMRDWVRDWNSVCERERVKAEEEWRCAMYHILYNNPSFIGEGKNSLKKDCQIKGKLCGKFSVKANNVLFFYSI